MSTVHSPLRLSFFLALVAILCFGLLTSCESKPKSNKPAGAEDQGAVEQQQAPPPSVYDTVMKKVQNEPENENALYHLADLYYRDGLYDKAVEYYRKVLSINPNRGWTYLKLGTSLSQLGKYQEAIDAFKQAVSHLPNPTVAYNNMAITYGRMEQYQDEADALKKAIEYRPRYAAARYNLGVTLLKLKDFEGARLQVAELEKFDSTAAEKLQAKIDKADGGQNIKEQ